MDHTSLQLAILCLEYLSHDPRIYHGIAGVNSGVCSCCYSISSHFKKYFDGSIPKQISKQIETKIDDWQLI